MRTCAVGLVTLLACGPVSVTPDESMSTTSDASSTTATPTTGDATASTTALPTTATTDAGTSTSSGDSSGFVIEPDIGGFPVCDVFAQDCPDGQKCSAWGEGGKSWNSTKCVPVMGSQLPGEPCTIEGGEFSGLDDCIEGAMCWDVDEQDQGTCVALCTGTSEAPICAPGFGCPLVSEPVLNLCLPLCDPLAQDCADDQVCLPWPTGFYVCLSDGSGDAGVVFDPCEYPNTCDKGLVCLPPDTALECDQQASGCCLPMCSLIQDGEDCPSGLDCLPVYESQPAGFEDVGYCSLPRPP